MIKVQKQKGESDDRLIARFRKKVLTSGVLLEYRDKDRFKSKSEKRKEKRKRIKFMIELDKKRESA